MKKLNILLILSLLLGFWSCSDTDHNPWKDNIKDPNADVVRPVDRERLGDLKDGINVLDDNTVAFVLFAPYKEKVQLVGTFNEWKISDLFTMKKEGDYFFIELEGFNPKYEYVYQYIVDDKIRIADPYSTKILDPKNDKYINDKELIYPNLIPSISGVKEELASVFSIGEEEYVWKVESFKLENPSNMIVYEMLLRDFTEERSLKAAQEKIPYLKELGVNVIELMPFSEFEGNQSWGYNPSFYFATDKTYGTEQAYKEFIDECHSNGIAVVMDMVLNHAFGQAPMARLYTDNGKMNAENPWFNVEAPHDYSWGYDFNHESKYTQAFVDKVNAYWLTEFKLDGFRFDFTKGFTNTPGDGWNYDASRVAILKRMTDEIRKVNKDAIIIFEHLTDNKEEKELSDYGIYLWGNMNHSYCQAVMGWADNDLSWTSFQERGWKNPTLVSYMESHDEYRMMFKATEWGNSSQSAKGYDVKNTDTALARAAAAAVIYYAIPGPKMIWEFGELGFQENTKTSSNENILDPMPPYWNKMEEPGRKNLLKVYQEMGKLKNEHPAFSSNDVEMSVGEGLVKQILLKSGSGNVCVVANFDVVSQSVDVNFGSSGEWTEHFTGTKLNVTASKQNIELKPGEYRLYKK